MERALAALHQTHHQGAPVTLQYAAADGRVGLFLQCADPDDEFVTGPIAANYPNCTVATAPSVDGPPPGWKTWSAELRLAPEVFPILRHAQFEDLLNGTFADPITGI